MNSHVGCCLGIQAIKTPRQTPGGKKIRENITSQGLPTIGLPGRYPGAAGEPLAHAGVELTVCQRGEQSLRAVAKALRDLD